MASVNISEAKAQLSSLIRRALAGDDVVISRRGKALVRLVAVADETTRRSLGWAGVQVQMAADFDDIPADFDDYR